MRTGTQGQAFMALQICQFLVVRCNSGVDALATAQFRYRALTSEAIQNNADLLLSGELTAVLRRISLTVFSVFDMLMLILLDLV